MSFKEQLYVIIFGHDTPAGKWFDIILIVCIVFSVGVVMLESVEAINHQYSSMLYLLEWVFTALFTVELASRLYCARKPFRYLTSFFGIVDLISILPTYLEVILVGSHYLAVVRILRVLRIFRILKFAQYNSEAQHLIETVRKSTRKIILFVSGVLSVAIILGSLMYIIEGGQGYFTSIPKSIYWAVVTFTTVGYGDITPVTSLGQAVTTVIMILGYSVIVVPSAFLGTRFLQMDNDVCARCGAKKKSLK